MAVSILPLEQTGGSRDRAAIANDAAGEVECLARLLVDQSAGFASPDDAITRGLSMRILALSSVVMSALGDSAVSMAELRRELMGPDANMEANDE